MAKRIEIVGAKPKRIEIVDQPKRRVDPAAVADALGANRAESRALGNVDPIGLAELGVQLQARLRSSGGRPALADADAICRVPLSSADLETLEAMVAQLEGSSGAKPSVGQLVSVIVHTHLAALKTEPATPAVSMTMLEKLLDEKLTPLREQVNRLDHELHRTGRRQ